MATSAEVLAESKALRVKVDAFGPAVNAFEARITALLKQVGGVPADVQADLDAAFAELRAAGDSADTTAADAADGVDEAA